MKHHAPTRRDIEAARRSGSKGEQVTGWPERIVTACILWLLGSGLGLGRTG